MSQADARTNLIVVRYDGCGLEARNSSNLYFKSATVVMSTTLVGKELQAFNGSFEEVLQTVLSSCFMYLIAFAWQIDHSTSLPPFQPWEMYYWVVDKQVNDAASNTQVSCQWWVLEKA